MSDLETLGLEQQKFFGERTSSKILFLRKVYVLFFIQFAVAAENLHISYLYDEDYVPWIFQHQELFILTAIAQLVLLILITVFRASFRNTPLNWITYIIWTVLFGYNMGYIGVWYDERGALLMVCAGIAFTSLSLMVYALITRYDLTFTGATIFILVSNMIGYEVSLIATDLPFWEIFFISLAGILFGYYYIYTTQNIVAKQSISADLEDPFVASILVFDEILLAPVRVLQILKRALTESS